MTHTSTPRAVVVIPNWNGKEDLPACLDSLLQQTIPCEIVVVENGSVDGSRELLAKNYPKVTVLPQKENLGFAGGVNVGIRYAIKNGCEYVALLNNDATVNKEWLSELVKTLEKNPKFGIVTSKIVSSDGSHLDSTGDLYTTWGLPYPRGRNESQLNTYDTQTKIFGASGGASLYRCEMLQEIGLFDEKFFAYYEDVDLSFRAQLAGWQVRFTPTAIAYHQISATSSRIKGFATYQTMKNLPMLFWKNVPNSLIPIILPRLFLAYWSMIAKACVTGKGWPAIKGQLVYLKNHYHVFKERRTIQKHKQVTDEYIRSILTWDLPPNAKNLRNLRAKWWKLRRKNEKNSH